MPIYSADDVLRIPIPPELSGYELVDGELEPVTPVGLIHGRIAGWIYKRLDAHVMQTRTPGRVYLEAGFVLGLRRDPQRLRGPDVSFITQAKLDQAGGEPRGFFHGARDLVVEIESAERPKALQQRIQDYLDAGTPARVGDPFRDERGHSVSRGWLGAAVARGGCAQRRGCAAWPDDSAVRIVHRPQLTAATTES